MRIIQLLERHLLHLVDAIQVYENNLCAFPHIYHIIELIKRYYKIIHYGN